ncbi:MAG: ParB/RepB/Spo0J family partition protein [Dehalococcoidia bacterium]|nr:ParB/RepB/Spo0J family partition protein [Dehalococcoidia bacterium]
MGGSPRLGRGLDALFQDSSQKRDTSTLESESDSIQISRITPDPEQPRKHFDEAELETLKQSIEIHGVLQPILVTRSHLDNSQFLIIAGERRWRAARAAGLDRIPCVVREMQDSNHLMLALVENLQRADLNTLEEAEAFRQLQEKFGLTQQEIGDRLGRSRSAIANVLRLLDLSVGAQRYLGDGSISSGHARALLQVSDESEQVRLCELIISGQLSVRDLEQLLTQSVAKRVGKSIAKNSEISGLEETVQQALGTKVRLRRNSKGAGALTIYFYSDEELTGILDGILGENQL